MLGKGPSADELAASTREMTPDPQANSSMANKPFVSNGDYSREGPPKDDMRRYWRQYETTPMVKEPVNDFARQVVEPGYRVEGDGLSQSQKEKLEKWLKDAAVLEKVPDNDIYGLLRKAVIQMEVRGTTIVEKIYAEEDDDKLYGLGFLNAENVRTNSRPNTPLLLLPGDERKFGKVPTTDDGTAAAYTEYPNAGMISALDPHSEEVNNYAYDDIIKITRDADVNEAYGTSRIESCSDAIENLKQKMRDNSEAIASKAYPLWLFMFGTEEQPWDRRDIDRFMGAHEMDKFHPGLKQGVRGDVSIETISGEVADIADYLQFDIDYIMSAMPQPKYSLGAFEQNINQFVTKAQERNVNRQIKDTRREIEKKFTPAIQEKAAELFDMGDDELEDIQFKLGIKGEEEIVKDPDTQTINYNGKGEGDGEGDGMPTPNAGNSQTSSPDPAPTPTEENSVWDVELTHDGAEELADPRFVSTPDVERDLSGLVDTLLGEFRDTLTQRLRNQYRDAPQSASVAFEGVAHTELNQLLRRRDFEDQTEVLFTEVVQRTHATLEQENQSVDIETTFDVVDRQRVSSAAQRLRRETRDAMEDLVARMDTELERGVSSGDSLENIVRRFESQYNDAELSKRAGLISRMNVQRVVEETKLAEFEQSDNVAGVKVINPCNDTTTNLCANLAGCGPRNGAVAVFDADRDLSEQWMEQVGGTHVFQGFKPLPPVPPFHYNCRSELVPLTAEELADAKSSGACVDGTCSTEDLTSADDLAAKYDIDLDDI